MLKKVKMFTNLTVKFVALKSMTSSFDFLLRAPSFSKAHYTQLPYQLRSV